MHHVDGEPVEVRILGSGDAGVLASLAPGVFDDPLDARATQEFLDDARHHLAVAVDDGVVVGMISAVHYAHPGKPRPEMWMNEVAVASTHHRRGVGKALMNAILERARELRCAEAWVLTDRDNPAAMRLYASAGGEEDANRTVMFTFRLEGEP